VFENRALRRTFGPKRDEMVGGWRKLRIEEVHNLYSSANIIRMMKYWWMRWAGYVARMGRRGMRIEWVPGALSPGIKWPRRAGDHSPPTSAEVKHTWIDTSTPLYAFIAWCLII
jgi:hypothetical protein